MAWAAVAGYPLAIGSFNLGFRIIPIGSMMPFCPQANLVWRLVYEARFTDLDLNRAAKQGA